MEESKLMVDNCSRGNESSSNSKPPNPLAGGRLLVPSVTMKSFVRHPSLVKFSSLSEMFNFFLCFFGVGLLLCSWNEGIVVSANLP